ncbi:MAG: ATP-binding protein [Cyclobacteriaceae bacterium]|nr:ATP-binding protein [Cyclobacteriaceae bacterium]
MASLGQLTAGIAHEINNPVNFILTGIEGLKENIQDFKEFEKIREHNCNQIQEAVVSNKINDDHHIIQNSLLRIANAKKEIFYDDIMDELDELVLSIKNGAVRTSEIVTGLRTFSRHDEDSWKLVNIHENIDSTLILLKNIYKDRVEIVKNYGTIPEVDCKPGKLNQVFMNLLVNAIQSIQGEGKVIISTSLLETGEKVRISISDTGTGIPEEIQNKIFDPFFTTKDVGEGTGLGLAITKGILEDHSAELTFITKYGKGTTFNIDIPIKQLNK